MTPGEVVRIVRDRPKQNGFSINFFCELKLNISVMNVPPEIGHACAVGQVGLVEAWLNSDSAHHPNDADQYFDDRSFDRVRGRYLPTRYDYWYCYEAPDEVIMG